jgi:predicted ATPase
MSRQDSVHRNDNISQALNLRWKLLLSNLVYAISSQDHHIVLVFEDLHLADEDTIGELLLRMVYYIYSCRSDLSDLCMKTS